MASDINLYIDTYENCRDSFIAFRNANREIARGRTYFDWRYLQRPNGEKPIIIWAENEAREKIGSLSLIPHYYMIDNRVELVGLLGDISVAKEWRRKGVAKQMFRYLAKTEAVKQLRACLVLPNEAATRPLMKANWRTVSTMTRYVKLINVEKKLERLFGAGWLSRLIAAPINFLLKVASAETYTHDIDGYSGAEVEGFDDRFDDLWNDAKKGGMIVGVRNRQYLTWRHANHPLIHYQIFTLMYHSRLCGYIVYHFSGYTCCIDDLFSIGEPNCQRYLVIYFLNHVRTTHASEVTFNVNTNDLLTFRLYRFGFIKRPDIWRIMIHVDDSRKDPLLQDGCKWFLTARDKDT